MAEVYKVLIFLKRKPGLSIAEFRDYYENRHRHLGEKYGQGMLLKYRRNYVDPVPNNETGQSGELDFDVITEMWFDREAYAKAILDLGTKMEFPADVLADEENVFDRSKTRYAGVVEFESDLPPVNP